MSNNLPTDNGEDPRLNVLRNGLCPVCATAHLIPGPRGGASQNYFCGKCGLGWNLHGIDHGIIDYEPLGMTEPATLALYRDRHFKRQ